MKVGIVARYISIFVSVLVAWQLSRKISPALITLAGLSIIAGSTVWLIVSLIKRPQESQKHVKSWWKLFWDGFWGL